MDRFRNIKTSRNSHTPCSPPDSALRHRLKRVVADWEMACDVPRTITILTRWDAIHTRACRTGPIGPQ